MITKSANLKLHKWSYTYQKEETHAWKHIDTKTIYKHTQKQRQEQHKQKYTKTSINTSTQNQRLGTKHKNSHNLMHTHICIYLELYNNRHLHYYTISHENTDMNISKYKHIFKRTYGHR